MFLLRLVKELTIREPNWREHTVIMLDNAAYHRSAFVKRKLADLGVPTLYLGPYHFKMAPVEMFFSHIKARNLNFMQTRPILSNINIDNLPLLAQRLI